MRRVSSYKRGRLFVLQCRPTYDDWSPGFQTNHGQYCPKGKKGVFLGLMEAMRKRAKRITKATIIQAMKMFLLIVILAAPNSGSRKKTLPPLTSWLRLGKIKSTTLGNFGARDAFDTSAPPQERRRSSCSTWKYSSCIKWTFWSRTPELPMECSPSGFLRKWD